MRYIILLVLILPGCKLAEKANIDENAIHTEIANVPNAVHVEKDAMHVEREAVKIDKVVEVNIPPKAVNVEPITVSPSTNIAKDAVHVEAGALQAPITLSIAPKAINVEIPPKAVNVEITLKVEKEAVVIHGAEAGAIQTKIETPWWAWVVMGILGLLWVITKFRRHEHSRELGREQTLSDLLF